MAQQTSPNTMQRMIIVVLFLLFLGVPVVSFSQGPTPTPGSLIAPLPSLARCTSGQASLSLPDVISLLQRSSATLSFKDRAKLQADIDFLVADTDLVSLGECELYMDTEAENSGDPTTINILKEAAEDTFRNMYGYAYREIAQLGLRIKTNCRRLPAAHAQLSRASWLPEGLVAAQCCQVQFCEGGGTSTDTRPRS